MNEEVCLGLQSSEVIFENSKEFTPKLMACMCFLYAGIYAERYIVFVFPFVRLYVRSFIRSFVLPSRL